MRNMQKPTIFQSRTIITAVAFAAILTTQGISATIAHAQSAPNATKAVPGKAGKAPAKPEPTLAELGPPKWVALDIFVPPTIAIANVPAGADIRANVDATIAANGRVKKIQAITVTPPNPAIEAAVAAVANRWVFTPPTENCIPIEGFVQGSLKIDLFEGKVRIFARRPPPSEVAEPQYKAAPIISNRLGLSQAIARNYPPAALKSRAEARVYMIASVAPSGGPLLSAEISHVITDQPRLSASFADAAQRAVQVLKFDPLSTSANEKGQMKTCVALVFSVANLDR